MRGAALFAVILALLGAAFSEGDFEPETHEFKAETTKLMDILIHSLYSDSEIFMRELLSNAADALEKARFMSLSKPGVLGEGEISELKIRVWMDREKSEIYIQDGGIGMDKDELITNLGTIAESGTRRFLQGVLNSTADPVDQGNLIGQFGVGFFSSFLVSDEVFFDTIRTPRNVGEELGQPLRWRSNSVGTFVIEPSPLSADEIGRGSRVTLHIRKDSQKYLSEKRIQELIEEYSGFLPFPINLLVTETKKADEVAESDTIIEYIDAAEPVEQNEDEEGDQEDGDKEDEGKEQDKEVERKVKVQYWKHVNDKPSLWLRPPSEVTDEEYEDFFKSGIIGRTKNGQPLAWSHFRGEGDVEFTALVFLPKYPPFMYLSGVNLSRESLLRLYVSRVYVTDELNSIIPRYLSWLTGIIDSSSVNINLSREMLQGTRALKIIGRRITSKVVELFESLAEDDRAEWLEYQKALDLYENWDLESAREFAGTEEGEENEDPQRPEKPEMPDLKWSEFYGGYGDYVKSGVMEDEKHRQRLLSVCRFVSSRIITKDLEKELKEAKFGIFLKETISRFTSLDEYMERAPEGQDEIYVIAGANLDEVRSNPLMEMAEDRNVEVLFFITPIDSFMATQAREYKDWKFVNIANENVTIPDFSHKPSEEEEEDDEDDILKNVDPRTMADMLSYFFRITLHDKLEKVVVSKRLTSAPALIVSQQGLPNAFEERVLEAQAMSESRFYMRQKRVMEVNMNNKIIRGMCRALFQLNSNLEAGNIPYATAELRSAAVIVYETASIQSGYQPEDLSSFSKNLFNVLGTSVKKGWLEPTEKDIEGSKAYHQRFEEVRAKSDKKEEPTQDHEEEALDEPKIEIEGLREEGVEINEAIVITEDDSQHTDL